MDLQETPVKHIVVAVDGSDNAARAVKVASGIARRTGSDLTILHVVSFPAAVYSEEAPEQVTTIEKEARQEAEKFVSSSSSIAMQEGIKAKTAIEEHLDSVVRGITEYAEKNGIDLIVIGTRGLGGFRRLILGSVASGVVHYAHCSVLVVR